MTNYFLDRGRIAAESLRIAMMIACSVVMIGSAMQNSVAATAAYPDKPIRLVLPFPPGAPSDMLGRMVGQKLTEQMGQTFVADNRAGAGGNAGIAAVAKAPPDGYTVLITSPTVAVSPSLYKSLPYDAVKDLTPVARLATIENVVLVHPSLPVDTLRQFVELARSRPGKLNFGSGGAGTTNHLANELLKSLEKINIVHVPYKGATQASVALIGHEVDEVIVAVSPSIPLIQSGKVKALAVLSEKRLPTLPNVPTSKESGVNDFVMSIWYGMFAPTGTPRAVINRLNQEVVKALAAPDMRDRMATVGIDPWPGTPEQLGELLRSETIRYAAIAKSAGLQKE